MFYETSSIITMIGSMLSSYLIIMIYVSGLSVAKKFLREQKVKRTHIEALQLKNDMLVFFEHNKTFVAVNISKDNIERDSQLMSIFLKLNSLADGTSRNIYDLDTLNTIVKAETILLFSYYHSVFKDMQRKLGNEAQFLPLEMLLKKFDDIK